MTGVESLIHNLQEGEGPDRELDIAIAVNIGGDPYDLSSMLLSVGEDCSVTYTNMRGHWNANFATKFGSHTIPVPRFASSLDACRALQAKVLPDAERESKKVAGAGGRIWRVYQWLPGNTSFFGTHVSEERAWLIAILKTWKEIQ